MPPMLDNWFVSDTFRVMEPLLVQFSIVPSLIVPQIPPTRFEWVFLARMAPVFVQFDTLLEALSLTIPVTPPRVSSEELESES